MPDGSAIDFLLNMQGMEQRQAELSTDEYRLGSNAQNQLGCRWTRRNPPTRLNG
jgi:hypothetical protein